MLDIIVPLIAGCAFILLGRWIYRNPKKLYPNWLYNNPDHPFHVGFARVFAIMAMVLGSFAVLGSINSLLAFFLPQPLPFLLTVGGVIVAALFLGKRRRQDVQLVAIPPMATASEQGIHNQTKRGYLSTKGKWVLGIALVISFVFGSASIILVFRLIGNSEACQLAVREAQSNAAVIERLGQPIKRGLIVTGSVENLETSGHADIVIPISGPKAKGTLYAVATKSAGLWKFETLQLAVKGTPNRFDLLQTQRTEKKGQRGN